MKKFIRKYIGDLFFGRMWYITLAGTSILFLVRFFVPGLGIVPFLILAAVALLNVFEYLVLFLGRGSVFASRTHAERLSNGDENPISLHLQNFYPFQVNVEIVDELPVQFQLRDLKFLIILDKGVSKKLTYELRPLKRGRIHFR